MLFRPPTNRKILNVLIAESCNAWILSFEANCRAEKKEDKLNSDCTVSDPLVTNLFPNMCVQNALLKLRSLMTPKTQLDTPFKETRFVIQNCISNKERVITAERAKFLYVVQSVG